MRFYDLWVVFKGLGVLKQNFSFKKTQISQLWYHEMFVFSESCLSQKTCLLQKIDCVFVLAIRGLLHMTKNFVMWCDFRVFNHYYGIFFLKKFFLQEIMVLSKTCVRFRNRIFKRFEWVLIKLSFFPWLLGKKICSPLWKKFGDFSILGVDFWVKPLERS